MECLTMDAQILTLLARLALTSLFIVVVLADVDEHLAFELAYRDCLVLAQLVGNFISTMRL